MGTRYAICAAAVIGMTLPASASSLPGLWGAPGAILTIDEHGGTLQQDCAMGRFGQVSIGRTGVFKVRGTWAEYAPGPQPADAPDNARTALYQGRLRGDTLLLSIRPRNAPAQHLTLLRNKRAKIVRCL